jgi:hypothetical protein
LGHEPHTLTSAPFALEELSRENKKKQMTRYTGRSAVDGFPPWNLAMQIRAARASPLLPRIPR